LVPGLGFGNYIIGLERWNRRQANFVVYHPINITK